MDWMDENKVELRGATPAMLVSVVWAAMQDQEPAAKPKYIEDTNPAVAISSMAGIYHNPNGSGERGTLFMQFRQDGTVTWKFEALR